MSRIKRVYLHALLCGITAWLFACEPDPVPFYPDAGSASDAASDQDTTIQDGGLTDADTDTDSITPSDAAPPSGPCNEVEWSRIDTGFIGVCGAGRLELTPGVHANGEWRDPSVCAPDGERGLSCTFEGFGRLVVEQVATAFRARYTADQDQVFGGTRLAGTAYLPEADAWLSNGFQSWSQSGVIAIPQSITNNERHVALRAQGDIEVIRNGRENSWWHTFVRSKPALVAGATTALGFRSWIGLSGIAPNFTVQFSSGGSGEALELPSGREIVGESWFIRMTNTVNEGLGEYATLLPSHVGTTARPEAGWNSWYELWDEVDEAAIRENATIVAEQFRRRVPEGHLPLRIVIDDGWQNGWGDWTANEKFPSGLAALSNELTEQGFNTGIWLAPLLVHARLPLVAEHPDWFVRDTVFNHLRHGEMKILDVTHPGAADHLRGIVRDLVNAGFTQLKIDFLFPGTYEGGRFDPVTGMQAYNRALQIIRETAGRDTVILGVGSPPIAGFDQVDAWRLGPDIAVAVFGASWFFVPNVGRAVAARWPYCRAVLCDGDPALLRTLPQNETAVGAWSAAFAGSALYLSDDLRDLPRERLDWLTAPLIATALAGGPSIPDPVPLEVPETLTTALSDQVSMQARHQVPSHWTLPSGEKVLINWTDHPQELDGTLYPGRSATLVTP